MSLRLATDIGGTFTDLVAFEPATGEVALAKAPTVPGQLEAGVLDAVAAGEVALDGVWDFVHGCTVVINAITERTGARTALVTTAGFRDVLEIGRGNRPDLYNLVYRKPAPFVRRALRFEVAERVDRWGRVLEPLDEEGVAQVAERCRERGVEAIAVAFLHSYANPRHERRAAALLSELLPGVHVTASCEVTRQWREYERTSTTVLSSYVGPVVERYLDRLEDALAAGGCSGRLHVMQSNGGTAPFRSARGVPIHLVESGPVAGIIGAAGVGEAIGEPSVIGFDVGGTTAKCSLVEGGEPAWTTEYKVEWRPDFAGYPICVPVVDIVEIGAGGGSIAWIDEGGALRVGPRSAGADPGPACYGRGGASPTVTDAKLTAGVLNPDYFLGGRLPVSRELAERALAELGGALGVPAPEAANGVIRLANASMVNALKLVSVHRGRDPRDYVLVAYGGGGPMHACALGAELRVRRVVVPPAPGHFSAWGMLVAEPRYDVLRTKVLRAGETSATEVEALLGELAREAAERFAADGASPDELVLARSVDMRYAGQEHTVRVPVAPGPVELAALAASFHAEHRRAYTFALEDAPVELVTFHLAARRRLSRPALRPLAAEGRSEAAARKGTRAVDFDVDGLHDTPVYERSLLPPGFEAEGPLLVEEDASTTLVHPGQHLAVDRLGNLVVDPGARAPSRGAVSGTA